MAILKKLFFCTFFVLVYSSPPETDGESPMVDAEEKVRKII